MPINEATAKIILKLVILLNLSASEKMFVHKAVYTRIPQTKNKTGCEMPVLDSAPLLVVRSLRLIK